MRLIIIFLLNIFCINCNAQKNKNYISLGTGAFFNTPMKDWKQFLGGNIEYGKYFNSGISLGFNFGYWSLLKNYQYNGIKITYPLWERSHYSFTLSGGANYFHKYKDLLFEYDLNSNIFLKNDYSLCISYCFQSGLGYERAQSFNIGISKDF